MSADAPTPETLEEHYERVRFVVALGTCPDCGGALARNPHVEDLYECLAERPDGSPCLWRGCTGE